MSPSADRPNIYSPLTKDNEIRILELEPADARAAIRCTLRHVTLSARPSYEALSYEWGPPGQVKAIYVNGGRTKVRSNLWLALQHLRLEKTSRFLWIDALCIHQADILERNNQVNQMGEIYGQAERVIAWLGPPDSASRTAFRLINQANHFSNGSMDMAFRLRRSHLDVSNIPTKQDLCDLRDFCWRSYWLRLWIVQEVLLAKDIIIQCGEDWCQWVHVRNTFTLLDRMARAIGPAKDPTSMMHVIDASIPAKLCTEWIIFRDKRIGVDQTPRPWVKILRHYSRCQCREIKDRMFALRALAPLCCQGAVHADYGLSVAALCTTLLSHQFLHHASSGVYEAMIVVELLGLKDRIYLQGGMSDAEVLEKLERMRDNGYSEWYMTD